MTEEQIKYVAAQIEGMSSDPEEQELICDLFGMLLLYGLAERSRQKRNEKE